MKYLLIASALCSSISAFAGTGTQSLSCNLGESESTRSLSVVASSGKTITVSVLLDVVASTHLLH